MALGCSRVYERQVCSSRGAPARLFDGGAYEAFDEVLGCRSRGDDVGLVDNRVWWRTDWPGHSPTPTPADAKRRPTPAPPTAAPARPTNRL